MSNRPVGRRSVRAAGRGRGARTVGVRAGRPRLFLPADTAGVAQAPLVVSPAVVPSESLDRGPSSGRNPASGDDRSCWPVGVRPGRPLCPVGQRDRRRVRLRLAHDQRRRHRLRHRLGRRPRSHRRRHGPRVGRGAVRPPRPVAHSDVVDPTRRPLPRREAREPEARRGPPTRAERDARSSWRQGRSVVSITAAPDEGRRASCRPWAHQAPRSPRGR